MRLIRLGAAAVNQIPLDWEGNLSRARAAAARARASGVTVLCLPELCLSGYGCEDAFLMGRVPEAAWRSLRRLAPSSRGMIVAAGLPVLHEGALYDGAALLVDGRLAGVAAKRHLAGDGVHYEPRWFKAWAPGSRATLVRDGRRLPFGDLLFDLGGVRVGFEICEEAWVPDRPGAALALQGADIILNPSASHFAFGKQETRRRFVAEGSRAFGVAYAYANLLGNESGRVIYDGATILGAEGRVAAEGPRFSFEDCALAWADVDVDLHRMRRSRSASFRPAAARGTRLGPGSAASEVRWEAAPRAPVSLPFRWPSLRPAAAPRSPQSLPAWERGPRVKEEEFARAASLGLFDYLRKSRSRGYVVSLSGGADSSAVATLAALSLRLPLAELGPRGLARKLAHVPGAAALAGRGAGRRSRAEITRRMLAVVYQGSANSSPASRESARKVASDLGAEWHSWSIDALARAYVRTAEQALGRRLSWGSDDLALQNIQARARAPGVWLLANVRGSLLLATSDRSEAAVGYATMDGDTAGGLSPIAGIDKAFLLKWLEWMGAEGPEGLGPVPALRDVARLAPSPELRPAAALQTAESDLMPYAFLDAVERAFIRDKQSPAEVLDRVRAAFPGRSEAERRAWVERFFRLWCRNQWKRERYAPSFHLDDESLDPKGWCRFPILSGGFEEELAEIRGGRRRS